MLSKYVVPGNRVEIQSAGRVKFTGETEKKKKEKDLYYAMIDGEVKVFED